MHKLQNVNDAQMQVKHVSIISSHATPNLNIVAWWLVKKQVEMIRLNLQTTLPHELTLWPSSHQSDKQIPHMPFDSVFCILNE